MLLTTFLAEKGEECRKKILAVTFLLILLAFSVFLQNVRALYVSEFLASYSTNYPVIDGAMGSAEWSDANSYDVSLVGLAGTDAEGTEVSATIYFKHANVVIHNIYIGLKVFDGDHDLDEFAVYFDEGDDGSNGSGTRDGVLTSDQEDSKACFSPAISGYTLGDGYCYDGGWLVYGGVDFDAECAFVVDHWECEFAIPFVGNDGGTDDVSDLVCTIADTVGIKIQYFTQPGVNNYYYPAGSNSWIGTYTTLSFMPPTGVIPEVPLGTILASLSMIIALVTYVAMPKFRKKQMGINP